MYMLDAKSTIPNNILNDEGLIPSEMYAPSIVPGIESNPSFKPIEYSMRFCFAYDAVDEQHY